MVTQQELRQVRDPLSARLTRQRRAEEVKTYELQKQKIGEEYITPQQPTLDPSKRYRLYEFSKGQKLILTNEELRELQASPKIGKYGVIQTSVSVDVSPTGKLKLDPELIKGLERRLEKKRVEVEVDLLTPPPETGITTGEDIVEQIQSQAPDRFKPIYTDGKLVGFEDVIQKKTIPLKEFERGYTYETIDTREIPSAPPEGIITKVPYYTEKVFKRLGGIIDYPFKKLGLDVERQRKIKPLQVLGFGGLPAFPLSALAYEPIKDVQKPSVEEEKRDYVKTLIEGVDIGKTTVGTEIASIANIGTYAVPYVGTARFITDIGSTAEKTIRGQKVSPIEYVTTGAGVLLVGGGKAISKLARARRVEKAITSTGQKVERPVIQEIRGFALQTVEGEKPITVYGVEKTRKFASYIFGAEATVRIPKEKPQLVRVKGGSEVVRLDEKKSLARQIFITDVGIEGVAETKIVRVPKEKFFTASEIVTKEGKQLERTRVIGLQKKGTKVETERYQLQEVLGLQVSQKGKELEAGASQFFVLKRKPIEEVKPFSEAAQATQKVQELKDVPISQEVLEKAIIKSAEARIPKKLPSVKPVKLEGKGQEVITPTSGIGIGKTIIPTQVYISYEPQPLAMSKFPTLTIPTQPSVAQITIPKEEIKTKTSALLGISSIQKRFTITKSRLREIAKQRERQLQKPIQREIVTQVPKLEFRILKKTLTREKQLQKTRQKTRIKAKQKIDTPIIIKSKLKIPYPPAISVEERVPSLKKLVGKLQARAYVTFVKRFGKIEILEGKPLPKGLAIKKGAIITRKTLGATFGILPKGVTQLRDIPFQPSKEIFRTYRIEKGIEVPLEDTWIQRRGKRLATRQEVKEIMGFKEAKGGSLNWF